MEALLQEDKCGSGRGFGSPEGYAQALRKNKFSDLGDAFASVFEEIHPAIAQRGDIGRAKYPGAEMGGGVVFIGHEVVGKGQYGLIRLPISAVKRAFRVV